MTALQRRLRELERRYAGDNRTAVAFVLWERSAEALQQAYEHALAAGAVRRGDPIIMGVMPGPAELPEARWSDVPGLSDTELMALFSDAEPCDRLDQTRGSRAVRLMSDAALNAAIIASAARPAP